MMIIFKRPGIDTVRFLSIGALSFSPCCVSLFAEEADVALSAQRFLTATQGLLKGVHTIEYVCNTETRSPVWELVKRESIHYIESPMGYRWERTVDPGASRTTETEIVTWDGKRGMTFDSVTGMIYTTLSAPIGNLPTFAPRGPLEPFAFLRSNTGEHASESVQPELKGLAAQATWDRFAKSFVIGKDPTAAAQPGWSFEVPGGGMPGFITGDTAFHVKVSEGNGLYPVSWERVWAKGDTRLLYTIDKWGQIDIDGSGKAWKYPVKAKIENLQPEAGRTAKFTMLISTDSIKINHEIEEDAFTIDPAIGSNIYDLNENTIISVPK